MGLNPTTASELLLTLEHHRHIYLLFFVVHSIYFSSTFHHTFVISNCVATINVKFCVSVFPCEEGK